MKARALILACSLCLASCTNPNGTVNNQQTDSLIGGGGGAAAGGILGNILGHGSAAGTLIGAAAGGALGYFAGSYIGSKLDERDQRVAAQNTTDILDEPVYEPPPGHATVIHHNPPVRHWTSDHSGATGSAPSRRSPFPQPAKNVKKFARSPLSTVRSFTKIKTIAAMRMAAGSQLPHEVVADRGDGDAIAHIGHGGGQCPKQ